jgi:hypothetical protein
LKIVVTALLTSSILLQPYTGAFGGRLAADASSTGVNARISLAKEWFHRICDDNIDRSQLDATTNMELTVDMVRGESARLRAFGKPSSFKFLRSGSVGGSVGYAFMITFDVGRIVELIAINADGKISGIDFQTYVPRST